MNIFKIEKNPEVEEIVDILEENKNIRMERILSSGQVTDWIIQDEKEFVILLQGRATIEFENEIVNLSKGDTLMIDKYKIHRVSYTSEDPICIWLCVFFDK